MTASAARLRLVFASSETFRAQSGAIPRRSSSLAHKVIPMALRIAPAPVATPAPAPAKAAPAKAAPAGNPEALREARERNASDPNSYINSPKYVVRDMQKARDEFDWSGYDGPGAIAAFVAMFEADTAEKQAKKANKSSAPKAAKGKPAPAPVAAATPRLPAPRVALRPAAPVAVPAARPLRIAPRA